MAKTKEGEKPREKKRGVGDAARDALKAGKTNQEALAAVKQEFPEANTSMSSINWYRNDLRKQGVKGVLSARELAAKAKAEAEKEAKKAEREAKAKAA